jgi:hypothetical protein
MEQDATKSRPEEPTIETIFAAELFSKLSPTAQDAIIDLIKSLLFG